MRIDGNSPLPQGIGPERSEKVAKTDQAAAPGSQDQTSFSSDKASLSWLSAQAMQMPEIRQDRVASLKSAIEKGNYALDPDQIAEAMLNEMAG